MTITDQRYLASKQYKDDANLNARIALHERYSVNPGNWFRWVFEHFQLPTDARVLELGCGPARLWLENLDQIPPGWDVTLSDFSAGMLAAARTNLAASGHPFSYRQIDAQAIPYADGVFDAVVANHMLYHMPDRPRAYAEIGRVLKKGARLLAATNGRQHMRELRDLVRRFSPEGNHPWAEQILLAFTLEDGAEQLAPWFERVELDIYEDGLVVDEAEPLIRYISSTLIEYDWPEEKMQALADYIAGIIAKEGEIRIQKATGLFIATR